MLIRIIEQYLESHKRLVVPQLGAFLVKQEPRTVVFSELLRRDDGVLQSLLVASGMSEVAARGEIDRLVYEVRHAVEAGERFYLSDFGEFYPGRQGTILFEYHPRLSVVPEAPVEIIPDLIEKVRPEPRHAEPKSVDVVEPHPVEPQQPVWSEEAAEEPSEEDEDVVEIAEEELLRSEERPVERRRNPSHPSRPHRHRKPAQPKKKPDYFMWVAIAAGVIALLAIGFGLYNEASEAADEASMEFYEPLIETADQGEPYGELND